MRASGGGGGRRGRRGRDRERLRGISATRRAGASYRGYRHAVPRLYPRQHVPLRFPLVHPSDLHRGRHVPRAPRRYVAALILHEGSFARQEPPLHGGLVEGLDAPRRRRGGREGREREPARAPVLGVQRDLEAFVVSDAPLVKELGELVVAVDGVGYAADVDATVVETGPRGRVTGAIHAAAAVIAAVVGHRALSAGRATRRTGDCRSCSELFLEGDVRSASSQPVGSSGIRGDMSLASAAPPSSARVHAPSRLIARTPSATGRHRRRVVVRGSSTKADDAGAPATVEQRKRRLVQLCARTDRGKSATPEVAAEIESIVAALEAVNPTKDPAVNRELITGKWSLLYTGASAEGRGEARRARGRHRLRAHGGER